MLKRPIMLKRSRDNDILDEKLPSQLDPIQGTKKRKQLVSKEEVFALLPQIRCLILAGMGERLPTHPSARPAVPLQAWLDQQPEKERTFVKQFNDHMKNFFSRPQREISGEAWYKLMTRNLPTQSPPNSLEFEFPDPRTSQFECNDNIKDWLNSPRHKDILNFFRISLPSLHAIAHKYNQALNRANNIPVDDEQLALNYTNDDDSQSTVPIEHEDDDAPKIAVPSSSSAATDHPSTTRTVTRSISLASAQTGSGASPSFFPPANASNANASPKVAAPKMGANTPGKLF